MAAAEGRKRRSRPVGIPNRWIPSFAVGAGLVFAAATAVLAGFTAVEDPLLSGVLFGLDPLGALATAFSGAGFGVTFRVAGPGFEATAFSGALPAGAGLVLLLDWEEATALGAVLGEDFEDFSGVALATAAGFDFGLDLDGELAAVDFAVGLVEAGLVAVLFFTGGESGAGRPSRALAGGMT